jgi:hypothetical protein
MKMRNLRHLHHRPQLQLSCAFGERFVKRDQPRCLYTGQAQHSIRSLQSMLILKSQHTARQRKVNLHHHRCAHKQAAFTEQAACSLKLRFGLPRQKPQNNVGVNGNQRACPQAVRALAATALQRMRLPLSCGASIPATSSTLRRATAFSTASPLRTSHCTASLAVMCKAVSTVGGTDKTVACSDWRINQPLFMKINFIASESFKNQDASYTQLRVWRDLNQDGISQAGELQTLDMREANKCVKVKRRETRKHAGIPKHFSNELIQIQQSDDINLIGWTI